VAHLQPRVFYTWSQAASGNLADTDFGRTLSWDVPLTEGYDFEFVDNVARRPGLHGFHGVRTPSLVRRIGEFGADAVLVYAWNLSAHLHALRHFKGRIPVFFRGDSTLLDTAPLPRRVARRLLLTAIYRHVDVAIAPGTASRDYFRWCGLPHRAIEYAPHSVDTRRFGADEAGHCARAAAWRAELGIAPGERVFVFAGKFSAKKDPLLLAEAFANADTLAHLVFIGGGALEPALRARAHPRIHVLPFQNQSSMPAAYRIGDVFVLPSRGPGETWGLVLNEAMACGLPVIASTRVGGAADLVVEGRTGWRFAAGDVDALARLIVKCAALPRAQLAQMGAAARQHVEAFSTEACVERMAEIFMRRGHPRPVVRP
jgi:glycosyltransferase involved in cell wall biosynthesis